MVAAEDHTGRERGASAERTEGLDVSDYVSFPVCVSRGCAHFAVKRVTSKGPSGAFWHLCNQHAAEYPRQYQVPIDFDPSKADKHDVATWLRATMGRAP